MPRTSVLALALVLSAGLAACSASSKPGASNAKPDAKPDAKSDSDAEAKPAPKAFPPLPAACDQTHEAAIVARLDAQCEVADMLAPVELVEVDRPPKATPLGAVEVELPWNGSLLVDGRPQRAGQWDEGVRSAVAHARRFSDRSGAPKFSVAVTAATRRDRAASMLRTLHDAGLTEGVIVLASNVKPTLPEPLDPELSKTVADELRPLESDRRATHLAKRVTALVEGCEAAQQAFRAVATVSADQRCSALSRGFAMAMVECGCPKEERELLAILREVNLGPNTDVLGTTIQVRLDSTQRLSGGDTWKDVIETLDLDAQPVVLGIQK